MKNKLSNINKISDSQLLNLWRGRIQFLLIVAIFVIPLLGAWWLYRHTEGGHPWATSNRGNLINPAYPLDAFNATSADDTQYTLENLQGKWTLLFIAPLDCDELCKKSIYHMRQVWASLGREAPRVQRVLLVKDKNTASQMQAFLLNYHDMQVVFDDDEQLIMQIHAQHDEVLNNTFLIDPLGNLMMAFPQNLDPRDMLKDLKKLLKVSTIG